MVEYNYDAWGNFVAEKVREACIGGATVDFAEQNLINMGYGVIKGFIDKKWLPIF